MAFFGGIAGSSDFVLTGARVSALREVTGTVRLEVTGTNGWAMLLHFGSSPIPEQPTTTISIDSEEYAKLRAGDLDLQGAFLTGKLTLAGDTEELMRLAMALMT